MKMYIKPLTKKEVAKYLSIKDLTLHAETHAVGLLYKKIEQRIREMHPGSEILICRADPIVSIEDNYDNLCISADNISRSSTYTHYVDNSHVLRTHTSAQMPIIMRELSKRTDWTDVVMMVPGLVYRRDVTDKKHVGQVHMLDVWRIVKNQGREPVRKDALLRAVEGIAEAAAPDWELRIIDSPHPYTKEGIEVNAVQGERDIEILECGLMGDGVLQKAGLDPKEYSGWALGMGLDRLVMTLKSIPDIRYLRSSNPDIAIQMKDLEPYKEVSRQPSIKRDMSYSVPLHYVEEDINEDVRRALGTNEHILESVEILSETNYADLYQAVRDRLGMSDDHKNILVRVTLRHLERSLTNNEANNIYDKVYAKINYGKGGYSS